ncbi:MAG TPA: PilZ domain-containing protein [Lacunisphaera sp.]|nr:PilZ domain-containing protein [Lacunisphaera sp.]
MLPFKQISNIGTGLAAEANKRKGSRFVINPTFPIKATLSLIDRNGRASPRPGFRPATRPGFSTKAKGIAWKDWTATLVDLSTTGANIHLNLAAVGFSDDLCQVKLSLGSFHLEIPGTVVHFRLFSHHAMCGLLFNFPDAETQKAYLQLLEPVVIGTSLAPVEAKPDGTGLHKEQYAGKNSALLTAWRQAPGGEMMSFDFRMNRYGVRWSTGLAELMTYQLEEEKPASHKDRPRPVLKLKLKTPEKTEGITPMLPLTEAQDEEVRWLFVLAVSNLSMSVAADLRKFLISLVVA